MKKSIAITLSLYEIMNKYKEKIDAIKYFEHIRWGNNIVCLKCGCTGRITPQKKRVADYWCGDCREYFNAFTDTPLQSSKVDVRKWIYASYTLMTSRKGISSLQLSKELGLTQKSAWYMLHRLRLVCGEDMEALRGEVEIDETYIGGKEDNKHTNKKIKEGARSCRQNSRAGDARAWRKSQSHADRQHRPIYATIGNT